MTLSNEESVLVMKVIDRCNELIDGKFIIADSKISKILKSITDSKEVFSLLSECMVNFNFDKEFSRAKIKTVTKPGYFKMPEEKYKILPMAFCILVDIENRTIDFPLFLKTYFKDDESMSEFANFANIVIKPFRNAISELFDLPLTINDRIKKIQNLNNDKEDIINGKEENINMDINSNLNTDDSTEEDYIENNFLKISKITNEMISTIKSDYKLSEILRDNALIVLWGIHKACELEDLRLLNALLIGYESIGGSIKSIRFLYKELKETMLNFY